MALERIATYGDLETSFTKKELWSGFIIPFERLKCPVLKDIKSNYLVEFNGTYEDNQCVAYDDINSLSSSTEKSYTLRIQNYALPLMGTTATGCTLNGVNWTINYGDGTSVTQSSESVIRYALTDNFFVFPQTVTTLGGDGSIVFDTINASATIWFSDGTSSVFDSSNIGVSLSGSVYTIKVGVLNINPPDPGPDPDTGITTTATVIFEAELPAYGYYTLFDVTTTLNSTDSDALQSLNSWVMPTPPYNPNSSASPSITLRDVPIGSTVYYKVTKGGHIAQTGQVGYYTASSFSGASQIALQSTTLSDSVWNSVTVLQSQVLVTIKMTNLLLN